MSNLHPSNPNSTATYRLFVGIDIAANTATAAWLLANPNAASKAFTLDQTKQGFAYLQQRLQATGISPSDTLVVMEATSTYWAWGA